jgi:hypothetical protein
MTRSISISFVIIIRFPKEGRFHQKQRVTLLFWRPTNKKLRVGDQIEEFLEDKFRDRAQLISLEIEYTEITWSNDMLSLLSNEIEKLEIVDNSFLSSIKKHQIAISFLTVLTIFGAGVYIIMDRYASIIFSMKEKTRSQLYGQTGLNLREIFLESLIVSLDLEISAMKIWENSWGIGVLLFFGCMFIFGFCYACISHLQRRPRIIFTQRDKKYVEIDDRRFARSFVLFSIPIVLALILSAIPFLFL